MKRSGLLVNNKKGLSDVVTSVLLILLVLAGIAIMWFAVRNFIGGATGQLDSSVLTTSVSVVSGSVQLQTLNGVTSLVFKAKRDSGDIPITSLNVLVEDINKKTIKTVISVPGGQFNQYETQDILVREGLGGLAQISAVSVVPVLRKSDGGEIVGTQSDVLKISSTDQLVLNDVLAYYTFDSADWVASQVKDKTANAIHGTTKAAGSVVQSTSESIAGGQSAYFKGVFDQGIEFPVPSSVGTGLDSVGSTTPGVGQITFMVWVKPDDDKAEILYAGNGGGGGAAFGLNVLDEGNGKISVFNSGGSPNWRNSPAVIGPRTNDVKWHHVAVTVSNLPPASPVVPNSGASYLYYVDGSPLNGGVPLTDINPITSNMQVRKLGITVNPNDAGGRPTPTSALGYTYKGYMDEVMIFKKALSADEVKQIYNYFNARRK